MASAEDIKAVRLYADVPYDEEPFSDTDLGLLIDSLGVSAATAEVLRRRIPLLDTLVDTTEAGASHKLSDVSKKARESLAYWEGRAGEVPVGSVSDGPRVRKIIRS